MTWLVETLRQHPELAIFLVLALGHGIGALRIGAFPIGSVTGVLLAGIAVGQIGIVVSPHVKSIFFLLFLFAVGYAVGPQFFRGLRQDGLPQAVFAVLQCVLSLVCVYAAARLLGYDAGKAAGLLAGSQTGSVALGVASDAIRRLDVPVDQQTVLVDNLSVAFAVTYIFGTAGSAWLLASLGPKLLGVDLAAECKALEAALGGGREPGALSVARRFDVRTYLLTDERWADRTVADFEARLADSRTSIERLRRRGAIADAEPETVLQLGDVVAVVGRHDVLVEGGLDVGPEVEDRELMDFSGDNVDVVVTSTSIAGRTLQEIADSDLGRARGRGVYLRSLVRGGVEMPFTMGTRVDRGDVLQIVGSARNVERAAAVIGYVDRATDATDMLVVGIGIVLGGLVGALTVSVGGIPLTLSTSGGTLFAGLVFGWLRSVHRTFGRVPAAALWILNSLGLTIFVAAVGIEAGPSFVSGVRSAGLSLFLAGIVVTALPLIAGVLLGKHVFKFHPGITLGAAAGARTATAALSLVEDVAGSKVPALGYTVTYAVGNTLLTIWGLVMVLLIR
jgi:putative transport protein